MFDDKFLGYLTVQFQLQRIYNVSLNRKMIINCEGLGYGLHEGITLEFAWRDYRKT